MKLKEYLTPFALSFVLALAILSCANSEPHKPGDPDVRSANSAGIPNKEEKIEQKKPKPKSTKKEVEKKREIPADQLAKAKDIVAEFGGGDLSGIDAKAIYKMRCSICHGFTGDLNVNGASDLTETDVSLVESVAQIYFGKGLMTPFKGQLKEGEIVAVAKYIEELR